MVNEDGELAKFLSNFVKLGGKEFTNMLVNLEKQGILKFWTILCEARFQDGGLSLEFHENYHSQNYSEHLDW